MSRLGSTRAQVVAANRTEPLAEYEETEYGVAGYFLYYSLQQFHTFMKSFHDKIVDNGLKQGLNIIGIMDDLKDPGSEDINAAGLMSGVLTVFAGLSVSSNPVAGAATTLAGVASIASNFASEPDVGTNGGKPLADRVLNQFNRLNDFINGVNSAVFGIPGFDPHKNIPVHMQRQSFASPAVKVLGDGQWLTADPTKGLGDVTDEMYRRMVSQGNNREHPSHLSVHERVYLKPRLT